MPTFKFAFSALVLFLSSSLWAQEKFSSTQLSIGIHLIKAEVASTFAQRAQGLMHRKSMGKNEGMVFRFDQTESVCMWMRNTLIPLSVAFIDDAGVIINIADMKPHDETNHCANKPARYALEMNKGWFAERKIQAGSKISGLPQ